MKITKKNTYPKLEKEFINFIKNQKNLDKQIHIDIFQNKYPNIIYKNGRKYIEVDFVGSINYGLKKLYFFIELDEYSHSNHPYTVIYKNKSYSYANTLYRQKIFEEHYKQYFPQDYKHYIWIRINGNFTIIKNDNKNYIVNMNNNKKFNDVILFLNYFTDFIKNDNINFDNFDNQISTIYFYYGNGPMYSNYKYYDKNNNQLFSKYNLFDIIVSDYKYIEYLQEFQIKSDKLNENIINISEGPTNNLENSFYNSIMNNYSKYFRINKIYDKINDDKKYECVIFINNSEYKTYYSTSIGNSYIIDKYANDLLNINEQTKNKLIKPDNIESFRQLFTMRLQNYGNLLDHQFKTSSIMHIFYSLKYMHNNVEQYFDELLFDDLIYSRSKIFEKMLNGNINKSVYLFFHNQGIDSNENIQYVFYSNEGRLDIKYDPSCPKNYPERVNNDQIIFFQNYFNTDYKYINKNIENENEVKSKNIIEKIMKKIIFDNLAKNTSNYQNIIQIISKICHRNGIEFGENLGNNIISILSIIRNNIDTIILSDKDILLLNNILDNTETNHENNITNSINCHQNESLRDTMFIPINNNTVYKLLEELYCTDVMIYVSVVNMFENTMNNKNFNNEKLENIIMIMKNEINIISNLLSKYINKQYNFLIYQQFKNYYDGLPIKNTNNNSIIYNKKYNKSRLYITKYVPYVLNMNNITSCIFDDVRYENISKYFNYDTIKLIFNKLNNIISNNISFPVSDPYLMIINNYNTKNNPELKINDFYLDLPIKIKYFEDKIKLYHKNTISPMDSINDAYLFLHYIKQIYFSQIKNISIYNNNFRNYDNIKYISDIIVNNIETVSGRIQMQSNFNKINKILGKRKRNNNNSSDTTKKQKIGGYDIYNEEIYYNQLDFYYKYIETSAEPINQYKYEQIVKDINYLYYRNLLANLLNNLEEILLVLKINKSEIINSLNHMKNNISNILKNMNNFNINYQLLNNRDVKFTNYLSRHYQNPIIGKSGGNNNIL